MLKVLASEAATKAAASPPSVPETDSAIPGTRDVIAVGLLKIADPREKFTDALPSTPLSNRNVGENQETTAPDPPPVVVACKVADPPCVVPPKLPKGGWLAENVPSGAA